MPNLYIIAGCNGAGKTTASFTLLPEMLNCKEFVNADGIAAGLSPFNPESVAIESGKIMLNRIKDLLAADVDFAIETTLATKSYVNTIKKARSNGYKVTLVYFWLSSYHEAIQRVAARVKNGGHQIPHDVIERRYARGLYNLFNLYLPICNYWLILNNMQTPSALVCSGEFNLSETIYNNDIWSEIKKTM